MAAATVAPAMWAPAGQGFAHFSQPAGQVTAAAQDSAATVPAEAIGATVVASDTAVDTAACTDVATAACTDVATAAAEVATGATLLSGCHIPSLVGFGAGAAMDGAVKTKREMRREDGRNIMVNVIWF